MPRVVGTDPGTSSLDLILLDNLQVVDQARLDPGATAESLIEKIQKWENLDLIAGPSGYGLPLLHASELTPADLDLMSLVRPDEASESLGVSGFRRWVEALAASSWPVVFLPGGIHLPSIPSHRKWNRVDLGTADKVAVAALALHQAMNTGASTNFALVEVGSAFTSVLVLQDGAIVHAAAGTAGPMGLQAAGAWDGEVAYLLGPLSKNDLFRSGLNDLGPAGIDGFLESLTQVVAGLQAVVRFESIYVSGAGADDPRIRDRLRPCLEQFGQVLALESLPGAWVKHAAQGAALLADGLAGGKASPLVSRLRIREARGTIGDSFAPRKPNWLVGPGTAT